MAVPRSLFAGFASQKSIFMPAFTMTLPSHGPHSINFSRVTKAVIISETDDQGTEMPLAIAYISLGHKVSFAYLAELSELE